MIKQVTEVDAEFLSRLDSDIQEIKRGLQSLKAIAPEEFLTAKEFMERAKFSRWKFDALVREGHLKYKKIGRKFYVNSSELTRYFNGEISLT